MVKRHPRQPTAKPKLTFEWGARIDRLKDLWGASYRGWQKVTRLDKTSISRVVHGAGTLKHLFRLCRHFEFAPPPGLLSKRQTRLLVALDDLRRALEERYVVNGKSPAGPELTSAIEKTLEAFVAFAEVEAARLAPIPER